MNSLIYCDLIGENLSESMDRTYNLYIVTHDEIKAFDCGSKFHPIYSNQDKLKTYKPLLSEVFDLVKSNNSYVKFNIEIKSQPSNYAIYTPQLRVYIR